MRLLRYISSAPVLCVLLLSAVALIFGQTVGHEFVNYDDGQYVYENPRVAGGLTLRGAAWAFTTAHAANWHPLTWLTHMLDVRLFGLAAGGHHLSSVLIHAGAVVLLFLVLLRMTGAPLPSAFTAAVFAIHPLRAESVAWVSERKDVLSGIFFMLTLWAYADYARRPFSPFRYLAVAVLFALGLMSKPMLVTLPFVLVLLDYWPLGRLGLPAAVGPAFPSSRRRVIVEKLPLLALAAGSCLVTFYAQGEAVAPIDLVPLSSRVANAVVSYAAYVGDLFYPVGLAVFYPHPGGGLPIGKVVASAFFVAGISACALLWRRRFPFLFVGWFWYMGMLIPVIGLVQVGSHAMADRYTYLPQIGLCLSVAWGAARLVASSQKCRGVCGAAAVLALLVLMGLAWRQTAYWRDSETLWARALACTARNFVVHYNLGDALAERGKVDAAIDQYRWALDIRPTSVEANYNLGNCLAKKGQASAAITHYRKALEIKPDHAKAHNNLGIALERSGRTGAAGAHYRRALEIDPDFADARYNLGNALAAEGLSDAAIDQYRKALEINPGHARAHNNLGTALERKRQADAAVFHYRRALEIRPDFAEAHNNLGIALEGRGQVEAAVVHYRKALEIKADYADAHHNLGIALANQGQVEAAIPHFRKALELNPGNTEARRSLDLLLGHRGRP